MKTVLKDKSDEEFKKPANVLALEVDAFAGGLPLEGQPKRVEYFIKGTEPQSPASIYQRLKISKNETGKLANDVEIAAGDYTEKDFFVFKENDPVSTDGKNRWQEGIDAWIASQSDERYKVPRETSSGASDRVVIKMKNPKDQTQYNEHDVQIEANAIAKKEVVKIDVSIDGILKDTIAAGSYNKKITFDTGPHEVKIKGTDSAGNSSEVAVKIGVLVPWNYVTTTPSPSPTLSPSPTPTPP